MLANYSEMDSEKFRQLMARQLALLGPAASIDDLVRALASRGTAMPKYFEFDDREVAALIGRVIADEIPKATRAALNTVLGRLD
jgi:hypothetical protein